MISILAPPSALMPPCELMSSTAMSEPIRSSWPCRAHGPESGAIIAILTALACARAKPMPKPGLASAPSAKPAVTLRRVSFLFMLLLPPLFRGDRHPVDPLLAEIGFDDAGIADDVIRFAGGDQPAVIEHGEMIDQLHHRLHRMLDDQHGNPVRPQLPDHRQNTIELIMCEPGQRLVEQHQPGVRDQGARQLHQP